MTAGERLAELSNRFYLRIRDRDAWSIAEGEPRTFGFDALEGHKYCLLVTYRRSGEPVPTPVWFGIADGKVYVRSETQVGKVKRIRANGRARVAPCNFRGKPIGPAAEGRARVLPPQEEDRAEAALAANYGLTRTLYEGAGGRLGVKTLYIEIAPVGEAA
ncbi:MAG TPA: PPOX class F420-dependent oxidoreductase [Solirubrobacterales bacterium]|nr:PPOX class F420-dependent oxidoreductase [Solirubrobacterales bacterium]